MPGRNPPGRASWQSPPVVVLTQPYSTPPQLAEPAFVNAQLASVAVVIGTAAHAGNARPSEVVPDAPVKCSVVWSRHRPVVFEVFDSSTPFASCSNHHE